MEMKYFTSQTLCEGSFYFVKHKLSFHLGLKEDIETKLLGCASYDLLHLTSCTIMISD